MSNNLSRDYTEDEVNKTLKQMYLTKAPSPDGMPPLFFQCQWHIVSPSTTKAILVALNSGSIPPALNYTYITLIPKKILSLMIASYSPISLCNVLYKFFLK